MTTNKNKKNWHNELIVDKKYPDGTRVWIIQLKTKEPEEKV